MKGQPEEVGRNAAHEEELQQIAKVPPLAGIRDKWEVVGELEKLEDELVKEIFVVVVFCYVSMCFLFSEASEIQDVLSMFFLLLRFWHVLHCPLFVGHGRHPTDTPQRI